MAHSAVSRAAFHALMASEYTDHTSHIHGMIHSVLRLRQKSQAEAGPQKEEGGRAGRQTLSPDSRGFTWQVRKCALFPMGPQGREARETCTGHCDSEAAGGDLALGIGCSLSCGDRGEGSRQKVGAVLQRALPPRTSACSPAFQHLFPVLQCLPQYFRDHAEVRGDPCFIGHCRDVGRGRKRVPLRKKKV